MRRFSRALRTMVFLVICGLFLMGSASGDGKRITKEEVKQMLGRPDVVIIDVRLALEWDKTELKIKGAVREDPDQVAVWMNKYPKDKTIVIYCS